MFNAHIELRRLLLGKELPPFTPLQCFEAIGGPRFNEYLPDRLVSGRGSAPAAEVAPVPSAATLSTE